MKKALKSRPALWPISMFWGLPMMVAAEPMLLARASPSRKGTGLSRAATRPWISTGVKARHTISLASRADRAAASSIDTARNSRGRFSSGMIRRADQA